jgi:magnesium transporter
VVHALLDDVVDGYAAVVAGLENDIDEVEDQLFNRNPDVSRRIYDLSREVIAFQRAIRSIQQIVEKIATGTVFDEAPGAGASGRIELSVEIERAFRDVQDHAIRYAERAAEFRAVLGNALTVHSTLVAQEQNEEMQRMTEVSVKQAEAAKKISSWAAVFLAPTLVAGIYGMNFDRMPELHWVFGYPFALAVMAAAAFGLYAVFKRVDWL